MKDDEIAVLAVRAILTHGADAVTVLDTRAARLRQAGRMREAQMWQTIADCADEFLHPGKVVH